MPVALRIDYSIGTAQGDAAMQSLAAVFDRADANLRDFGQYVFPRLGPVFEAELGGQFSTQGHGPFAGAWAPLSTAYAAQKAVDYPGQPLLVATGALREALTQASSPHAARDFTATDFAFGTVGLDYASFHQLGTGHMPARPPFDFTQDFEEALKRETQLGIVDAVRAADSEGLLQVTP